jgi:hypothetical protein
MAPSGSRTLTDAATECASQGERQQAANVARGGFPYFQWNENIWPAWLRMAS